MKLLFAYCNDIAKSSFNTRFSPQKNIVINQYYREEMIRLADSVVGGVEVINTLTQKNKQDFPIAMAIDIFMDDGTNVEDRVSALKNYSHPTIPGYKHIPAGGSTGQILRYESDGTAKWDDEINTTYNEATPSTAGLMSAGDKRKLNGIAPGANNYVHPNTPGNKHIPSGGAVGQILKNTGDGTVQWEDPTSYSNATTTTAGLMSPEDKRKLNGIASGANNYVHPSHDAHDLGFYKVTIDNQGHVTNTSLVTKTDIRGLGLTSQDISIGDASSSSSGLMSASDKAKLDGIASGANRYTHPSYTARSSGLYKITVDSTGHVSNVSAVTKNDITALGITGEDISIGDATTSSAGLMSASDKAKLDGIASGANRYTHPSYTARSSGLYKITVDSTGHVSTTSAVRKEDITALGIPGQDTNTWTAFKGASSTVAGTSGYVPGPSAGNTNRYFRSDGTWAVPPNTTYSVATTSTAGLMSASDKTKLDGIATGANKYTHPSYTARSSGLYKVTVDSTGHVSNVSAVTKSDITALGIPGQDTNTTYGNATTSTAGLMSAADKKKLDGITSGANTYKHPSYTPRTSGLYKIEVDNQGHVNNATLVTESDLKSIYPGLQIGFSATAPKNLNINDLWFKVEDGSGE